MKKERFELIELNDLTSFFFWMVWFLKRFQEGRQNAKIEQLKKDLAELNEDYTDMSREVQKKDQGLLMDFFINFLS